MNDPWPPPPPPPPSPPPPNPELPPPAEASASGATTSAISATSAPTTARTFHPVFFIVPLPLGPAARCLVVPVLRVDWRDSCFARAGRPQRARTRARTPRSRAP